MSEPFDFLAPWRAEWDTESQAAFVFDAFDHVIVAAPSMTYARLIAAAPLMLDTLKIIQTRFTSVDLHTPPDVRRLVAAVIKQTVSNSPRASDSLAAVSPAPSSAIGPPSGAGGAKEDTCPGCGRPLTEHEGTP